MTWIELADTTVDKSFERFDTQALCDITKIIKTEKRNAIVNGEEVPIVDAVIVKDEYRDVLLICIDKEFEEKAKGAFAVALPERRCSICKEDYTTCSHQMGASYNEKLCYVDYFRVSEVFDIEIKGKEVEKDFTKMTVEEICKADTEEQFLKYTGKMCKIFANNQAAARDSEQLKENEVIAKIIEQFSWWNVILFRYTKEKGSVVYLRGDIVCSVHYSDDNVLPSIAEDVTVDLRELAYERDLH